MQRSWAYLFYDIALFAVLLLPLALAIAVNEDRDQAALVYALLLATITVGSLMVARFSKLSPRAYWRSLRLGQRSRTIDEALPGIKRI